MKFGCSGSKLIKMLVVTSGKVFIPPHHWNFYCHKAVCSFTIDAAMHGMITILSKFFLQI